MKIFLYSDNGHSAVSKFIHNISGGRVVSTEVDSTGGTIGVVDGGASDYYLLANQELDIFPTDLQAVIPDPLIDKLARHTEYGITKGDTVSAALLKIRNARGGDLAFDPNVPF